MRPAPRSLLDFAGVPPHVADPSRAALVIIDAQEEYVRGSVPLAGVEEAIAEAARVRRWAQARGVPVFHIVHHGKPGSVLFNPEGPFSAVVPALTPEPGETVLIKQLPNSFAGTELHERLKQLGRTELVLVGFATHMCISSTARAALDLGYRTTVVARATATRDLPDGKGGFIPAQWVQASALAELGDRFATIVEDAGALPAAPAQPRTQLR
ncbi:cysteine hydrolase [Vitiosangium sp. GDMCC 1.1324]|nr:cysteine hydrolase [Vitiosangium sp. GDMCC 1.1324]